MRKRAAGLQGKYQFQGLAPGRYLLLASFDMAEIDEETLRAAGAQEVTLD